MIANPANIVNSYVNFRIAPQTNRHNGDLKVHFYYTVVGCQCGRGLSCCCCLQTRVSDGRPPRQFLKLDEPIGGPAVLRRRHLNGANTHGGKGGSRPDKQHKRLHFKTKQRHGNWGSQTEQKTEDRRFASPSFCCCWKEDTLLYLYSDWARRAHYRHPLVKTVDWRSPSLKTGAQLETSHSGGER